MKNYILVVFVVCFCCISFAQNGTFDPEKDFLDFEQNLKRRIITPTYRIQVENKEIRFEDFIISFSELNDSLKIYINKDTLNVHKLITQNIVEDEKQQVDYANSLLEVNHYKELNILMFLVHFYPCTGLGCGVNYQIIYHTKSNKMFAFGRFRTGFEMELYNYDSNLPCFLSKSYDGRNIEGIEKISYELFPLDFSASELKPLKNIFAQTVYDENKNEMISFQKQWIK